MARTVTLGQALNLFALRYPKLLSDGWGARFADEIIGLMWGRYPWRESIAELPPFHLYTDEVEYGAPLLAVPPDILGIHSARVMTSQGYISDPLTIQPDVRIDQSRGTPTTIGFQRETRSFRVHPTPAEGGADWWVAGSYKKAPTKVTNENVNGYVLPWEDMYFPVFRAGLNWKIKEELLNDPKWMNDMMKFDAMLERMAVTENILEGSMIISPSEGLSLGD